MPRNKVIYTAGRYSGKDHDEVARNIKTARSYAMEVWELGGIAICPHTNTAHMEEDCEIEYEGYMQGDFELIRRSDAVFMIPDWTHSKGACRERLYAMDNNIPVFYNLGDLAAWIKS